MATVLGMRGTGTFPSDFKHNDIRASYTYLMPNGDAPLNAILAMMKKTPAKTTRFDWAAQPFIQRRGAVTNVYTDALMSSAYASGGASGDYVYAKVAEATAKYIVRGNQVLLRKSGDTVYDCRALVISDPQLNGANSMVSLMLMDTPNATYDIDEADTIKVVGSAHPEGSALPKAMAVDPAKIYNFQQIFMNSLEATRTFLQQRGHDIRIDKAELQKRTLEFHMRDIDQAMIWSERYEGTGANNQPLHAMRGILKWLENGFTYDGTTYTGLIDDWRYTNLGFSGTWDALGEEYLDTIAETVFQYGSTERLCLCGQGALTAINRIVKQKGDFVFTPKTKTYGIDLVEWKTHSGTFMFKSAPLMNIDASDKNSMIILDVANQIKERPFQETFYVSDDDLARKTLSISGGHTWIDGIKEGYVTETSIQFEHPQLGAYITGIGKAQP